MGSIKNAGIFVHSANGFCLEEGFFFFLSQRTLSYCIMNNLKASPRDQSQEFFYVHVNPAPLARETPNKG